MSSSRRRFGSRQVEAANSWFQRWLPVFYANWIASLGSLLALSAAFLLVVALLVHVYQIVADRPSNPYVDLVGFMVLPMMLVGGLALVAFGNFLRHRRERRGGPAPVAIQIGGTEFLRKLVLLGFFGVIVVVLFATFSYEAYHYTDSNGFCLEVCHQVMEPEGVAYSRSAHSNVNCVDCHIGPGADWFVRAKISGIRQVFAVIGDTYQRPIPTPVENLRPARETCEECHAPSKFHGSKLVLREHVESDRENSLSVTALMVKVGGSSLPGAPATGVHWHVDPRNEVRYRAADHTRREILEVVQKTPEGEIRFLRGGDEGAGGEGEWRTMDCLDCHNRPTHIFETPAGALDATFVGGRLSVDVPWLRAEAERVLRELQPDDDTAGRIAARLEAIYAEDHPDDLAALRVALPGAAAELADILERNIFPQMDIQWGTYGSHLSHFDMDGEFAANGCFRCHDDELASESGETIRQDCDLCHALIAEREAPPSVPDYVQDLLTQRR